MGHESAFAGARAMHIAAENGRGGAFPAAVPKPPSERFAHARLRPVFMLIEARKYREARARVAGILEKDPEHAVALSVLIMLHGKLGQIRSAEQAFRDAVGRGIATEGIYGGMVDAYAGCGMFKKARIAIGEAAWRHMDCVHNYKNMMAGLYARGRYEDVVSFHRGVPHKYAHEPGVMLKLADALRKMALYGEAIEAANAANGDGVTLDERTKAGIIIAYSEMHLGNPQKAYEILHGIHGGVSQRWDGGLNLRFYPRLLCGMVFASYRGGIPQPEARIGEWRGQLMHIKDAGRGKTYDLNNALSQLDGIPRVEDAAVPA